MSLSAQQRNVAQELYALARQRGLPDQRAREFVAAAFAESHLDPHARNPSSGAAGEFQLLNSGYRRRAKQLGGLDNPRANALAILPSYLRYWRQHPDARPGEAGRDVELSGKGSSFYSSPLALLSQLGGGDATGSQGPVRAGVNPLSPGIAAAPDTRSRVGNALLAGPKLNVEGLSKEIVTDALRAKARTQAEAEAQGSTRSTGSPGGAAPNVPGGPRHGGGGIAELILEGTGGPTNSTGPHLHYASTDPKAMLAALAEGKRLGLSERENPYVDPVDPVHARNSFHDRTFPGRYNGRPLGEATDFSGDPAKVRALKRWIQQHYGS